MDLVKEDKKRVYIREEDKWSHIIGCGHHSKDQGKR